MAPLDPQRQHEFAVKVVEQLQAAGHIAYFAGGCVRDQLLGREPKDFDVATNARPEQIRELFGRRRTLPIGAAFGVITVIGPTGAGRIDVATFRRDQQYSDGRHPDSVVFSTAEEDAKRRDFTINGMFFDPANEAVIDYVGGQEDLRRGLVRAIGNPADRFAEDKLRMLRAVRFAALFAFDLEPATASAIRTMAGGLTIVSAERIAAELKRMLLDPHRVRALSLLRDTGLLEVILGETPVPEAAVWDLALRLVDHLEAPTFPAALAALLGEIYDLDTVKSLAGSWRLSNDERDRAAWLIAHRDAFRGAANQPWSKLQPLLIHPGIEELLVLGESRAEVGLAAAEDVAFCRERLSWPPERLDPAPLLTGDDLAKHGVPRGKVYRRLLEGVREAQLLGQIGTPSEALALVDALLSEERGSR